MKGYKKDDTVIFDFVLNRMLKLNERIIYAEKKLIELHPFEENCTEYVIITLDDSGTVRKYAKECKPLEKWLQIAVM